jgi:hypothetical protein
MPRLPGPAAASTTLEVIVALAIFPACSDLPTPPPVGDFGGCPGATSSPPMPRALIGPDVDVRVLCGGTTQVPIASVDELGAGFTKWSFTVAGDSSFGALQGPDAAVEPGLGLAPHSNNFVTCQANSPQVAFVGFNPPADALPGTSFDAIATVHSEDRSFADGTVRLHGEIVTPVVTVDKTSVDFGSVGVGDVLALALAFTIEGGAEVFIVPDSYSEPPFSITLVDKAQDPSSSLRNWSVAFQSNVPGDYSASVGWQALPATLLKAPTPCIWATMMTLHARVVGDGGADSGSPDASDARTDLAPDAP